MTPDLIVWPPPLCPACRDGFCTDCDLSTGCEHDCPWLYPSTVPMPREGQ